VGDVSDGHVGGVLIRSFGGAKRYERGLGCVELKKWVVRGEVMRTT